MPRDDRPLFHRRGRFVAVLVGVLAILVCVVGLMQRRYRRQPRVWCESYSPGYDPKGCSAADDAAWARLGIKRAPPKP